MTFGMLSNTIRLKCGHKFKVIVLGQPYSFSTSKSRLKDSGLMDNVLSGNGITLVVCCIDWPWEGALDRCRWLSVWHWGLLGEWDSLLHVSLYRCAA